MTFQWAHEVRSEAEILRLSGHFGFTPPDLDQMSQALTHHDLPLILDLTELEGWGHVGRSAVVHLVRHLTSRRPTTVHAPRDGLTLWALRDAGFTPPTPRPPTPSA